jgi:hypothetical protein
MAEAVYVLCTITSVTCAVLLLRSYLRSRTRFLMWSSAAFVGFAINNIFLFVDLMVVVDVDLQLWRSAAALAALGVLVVGLVLEVK